MDYWGLLSGGSGWAPSSVELGGSSATDQPPKFVDVSPVKVTDPLLGEISVYDLVFKRIEQMKGPSKCCSSSAPDQRSGRR